MKETKQEDYIKWLKESWDKNKQSNDEPITNTLQVGEIVISSSSSSLEEIQALLIYLLQQDVVTRYLGCISKEKMTKQGANYAG